MGGNSTDRVSPAIKSVRERGYGVGGKRDKNESKRERSGGVFRKKGGEKKGGRRDRARERERERERDGY
jgi:hypothetical protein